MKRLVLFLSLLSGCGSPQEQGFDGNIRTLLKTQDGWVWASAQYAEWWYEQHPEVERKIHWRGKNVTWGQYPVRDKPPEAEKP